MTPRWSLFENFAGSVCIVEAETDRLVYMNARLRRFLGFDEEEYKGLSFHDALRGSMAPNEPCSERTPKEGEFTTCSYRDPATRREYVLHETLVSDEGKTYRAKIAMDRDEGIASEASHLAHGEQVLGECLQQMFSTADENQALETLLRYIGSTFSCERAYIFEVADSRKTVDNTYEWCAEGVEPQKELLQGAPYEGVAFWFDVFDEEGAFSIEDIEEIRDSYPLTYAVLKPQDIRSLIVGPIRGESDYVGFIGVDNPPKESVPMVSLLVRVIGYFVSVLLKRRDLTNELRRQSHCDPLTGAFNRNALAEFFEENRGARSLGIVYCDISGLKLVNDTFGHDAGDELIVRSHRLLSSAIEGSLTFRVGGDEFVLACPDVTQAGFLDSVEELRRVISAEKHHIAVGSAWTDVFPSSFDDLLIEADQEMYRDKESYYRNCDSESRRSHDRRKGRATHPAPSGDELSRLLPTIMSSDQECYVCIGDYRNRLYYLSDGMKRKFGFPGNAVSDFLGQWEERIVGEEQRRLFRSLVAQTLQEKRTHVSFSFAMQDHAGSVVMSRGSALLHWNADYSEPLMLLSSVQTEPNAYATDPITTLPATRCAIDELESLDKPTTLLLFKLNSLGKINELKGMDAGNRLLKSIADELRVKFGESASFFRLEGMKFMALLKDDTEGHQKAVDAIRETVAKRYEALGVAVPEPVIFMPVEYSKEHERPVDLVKNVAALISAADFSHVSHAITNSSAYLDDLKQEISMEFALARDIQNQMANFRIVIQPEVSTASGEVIGGEVLLRWTFQGNDVPPTAFIPIIERERLMGIVGKWVLEQTARCCRTLSICRPDMYLSFNVSYQQILLYDFADIIGKTLEKYGLEGRSLVAELTETYGDESPSRLKSFIESCEAIGVRVALDDFGNGYSTLGLLLKYPAQIIKLDRSILREMAASQENEHLVRGLVDSCHKLGRSICFEGVETEDDLAAATKVGCDIVQGFFFYRPMELEAFYREMMG